MVSPCKPRVTVNTTGCHPNAGRCRAYLSARCTPTPTSGGKKYVIIKTFFNLLGGSSAECGWTISFLVFDQALRDQPVKYGSGSQTVSLLIEMDIFPNIRIFAPIPDVFTEVSKQGQIRYLFALEKVS